MKEKRRSRSRKRTSDEERDECVGKEEVRRGKRGKDGETYSANRWTIERRSNWEGSKKMSEQARE